MANERINASIKGMKVNNARRVGKTVFFTLSGNGFAFYNMRVVEGSKGEFISPPQTKGKDGEYYNVFSIYLSDEDQARVIARVKSLLPNQKDGEEF